MKTTCCLSIADKRSEAGPRSSLPAEGRVAAFALFLAAAVFVGAQESAPPPSGADRARRLQLNEKLIHKLVHGGLLLASEDDPLRRAEHCNLVAAFLADEMGRAADQHEDSRMEELGQHLHLILQHGIAPNLVIARKSIPTGSHQETMLKSVGDTITRFTFPLEERLQQRAGNERAVRVRIALEHGRADVERALSSADRPR